MRRAEANSRDLARTQCDETARKRANIENVQAAAHDMEAAATWVGYGDGIPGLRVVLTIPGNGTSARASATRLVLSWRRRVRCTTSRACGIGQSVATASLGLSPRASVALRRASARKASADPWRFRRWAFRPSPCMRQYVNNQCVLRSYTGAACLLRRHRQLNAGMSGGRGRRGIGRSVAEATGPFASHARPCAPS